MNKFILLLFALLFHATPLIAQEVVFVHNNFVSDAKFKKLSIIAKSNNVNLKSYNISQAGIGLNKDLEVILGGADLVVFDTPRPSDREQVKNIVSPIIDRSQKNYLIIGGGKSEGRGLPPYLSDNLIELYDNGGSQNFSNFFKEIFQWKNGGKIGTSIPQKLPDIAIYYPNAPQIFSQADEYLDYYNGLNKTYKSQAVFVVHPSVITDLATDNIDEFIKLAETKNILPIVILWNEAAAKSKLSDYFNGVKVDAIVNMTHIQRGQKLIDDFKKINAPIFQTLRFSQGNEADFIAAKSGSPPPLTATFISVPETWGFSDPLVLSVRDKGREIWIKSQVNLLFDKINSVAKLKANNNSDKKIAIMYWNYPSGEKNLSASNLNIPISIENIIKAMFADGYQIPIKNEQEIIANAQDLLSVFYDQTKIMQLYNDGKAELYPVNDYVKWVKSLPESRRQQLDIGDNIYKHWAVIKQNGEYYFVIPRWKLGNLEILPQPPRGLKLGDNYHSLESVPDALYMATYLYLQQNEDALIHLGTHGTQEWTPGKDRGLWAYDYPNLTAGNLPIIYPYIQDNIAEAIQAKRRGRAIIISHQTAPLSPSGLYDELRDMHTIIHEYVQLDEGMVRQKTRQKLIDMAVNSNIAKDIGWDRQKIDANFNVFFDELHNHLHELARLNIPLGLHHFGQSATDEQRIIMVMQQLGHDYFAALGLDPEEALNIGASEIKNTLPYKWLASQLLEQNDAAVAKIATNPQLDNFRIQAHQNYANLASEQEMTALLNALSGGYIEPGTGGDPIRQPQSISGRNLYAFEANKIPSTSAYEAGTISFAQLVNQYQQKNPNSYPDKIAFSLWSSETIRHLGVTEAQILNAIGAKPIWDSAGRIIKLEIIPREKLNHPRVDVVIQATSVYRDQFDYFMQLLAETIDEISNLEEDDNQIYLNSHQIEKELIAQNIPKEQAKSISSLRIFSNKPGEYGSGLPKQALKYDIKNDENDLAQGFLNRMQYAYGKNIWGNDYKVNLFAENLKHVDMAIMSRSSNVHGVLSSDHSFEYLGGLSVSIKAINGKAPDLYITDIRTNSPKIVTAQKFLSDEMRTRYLNPEWIKSMQKEGYAGTLEVLEATNNLYGWNATDKSMVRADQWQDMYDTYVKDKRNLGIDSWFKNSNPQAQMQILTRMAEAIRKNLWQADETTKQELLQKLKELQSNKQLKSESTQLDKYIAASTNQESKQSVSDGGAKGAEKNQPLAKGKGLAQPSQSSPKSSSQSEPQAQAKNQTAPTIPQTQKVNGLAMELIKPPKSVENNLRAGIFGILSLLAFGMAFNFIQQRKYRF